MNLPGPENETQSDGVHPPDAARDMDVDGARDGAMDALVAGARVNGGDVMDDSGYVPLANHEVGRIRGRVLRFLQDQETAPPAQRVSRAKIAKAIGESPSTLSQVLACKYPKGKETGYQKRDAVWRKLDKFLALQDARRDAPRRSGFVWTRVAEEIRAVAQTCVLLESMGTVYGPAGIGKTLCVDAMLDTFPGSVKVTIEDGTNTPPAFLRELAAPLKLGAAQRTQSIRRAVCDHLRGSKRLIMVDEAHLAKLDTLNCIRQIHDATGCPVLLAGLPALARLLTKGRDDDAMGATLFSRQGIVRDLTARCRQGGDPGAPLYSKKDIASVFAKSALRIASDGMQWLDGLANEPEAGGLRLANNALRLATHVAQTASEPVREITVKALLDASRLLKGTEAANAIANRVKQRRSARVA